MRFWDTEEGKILAHGIHEHSRGMSYIINSVAIIKALMMNGSIKFEGDDDSLAQFNKYLELILEGKKVSKDSIDFIYTKFKDKFESQVNE